METHEVIDIINSVYEREEVEIKLSASDFEGAVIKKLPKADICRWKTTDINLLTDVEKQGILNKEIVDRVNQELTNPNGQTHLTYNKDIEQLFSAMPIKEIFNKFALVYPCSILEGNLGILMKYIPNEYYSQERKNYLSNKYNSPLVRHKFPLSLKIEEQNRVMLSNKTSILESDIPNEDKIFILESRFSLFVNDYVIILKYKKQMKYLMVFLPMPALQENELQKIGDNKFVYTVNGGGIQNQFYNVESLYNITGENLLVFGAPGTGKSNYIKENYEKYGEFVRVVFHEEYSYQDFIGCIKPVLIEGIPTYKFVPGPFSVILKLALENRMTAYNLIIEELNRANAASVFGDTFQLLDRDNNGNSEYSIENTDILNYLNTDSSTHYTEIRIPNNLSIVATMNSADQGVFPLDTAFKRRWNYEYMAIEFKTWHEETYIPYFIKDVESNSYIRTKISVKNYVETINDFLSKHTGLEVNEDRLIGPYYLKPEEWENWESKETYKKLLSYLWDDVARLDRKTVFKSELTQFNQICKAVKENRQVFSEELNELLKNNTIEDR